MNDSQDNFSPALVDSQIDNPDGLLSSEDARFIHNVRTMFAQEKQEWLENGWARLLEQRANTGQQADILDFSAYKQNNEKAVNAPLKSPSALVGVSSRRRIPRQLSLLAAVLVCIVLVGGLLLVQAESKRQNTGSSPGNPVSTATAQPSTATPALTIPSSCKGSSTSDVVELMLCEQGEETTINITKSLTVRSITSPGEKPQTGTVNVTFLRAYADKSRLILVYKINSVPTPAINWSGFTTLSTQQGSLGANSSGFGTGYQVQSFDTSSLPASSTELQVKKIITEAGSSTSLVFTLPFHSASKTVTVRQTVTNNKYSLTLDHIVFTGSTTTFFYSTKSPAIMGMLTSVESEKVTINGKQVMSVTSTGSYGVDSQGNGQGELVSYQSLLNQPGIWTVKMVLKSMKQGTSVTSVPLTGIFTFTVPA
jgi:hypothetical protein